MFTNGAKAFSYDLTLIFDEPFVKCLLPCFLPIILQFFKISQFFTGLTPETAFERIVEFFPVVSKITEKQISYVLA